MGSSSGFESLCYTLLSCYAAFGAASLFQLGRIVEREQGMFDPMAWIWPMTVQQQIHLIVFLLACVRAAFFFIAISAWNSSTGLVESRKIEFYSLDEFATVLFFTLASVLALFWAELYYISTDVAATFVDVVRPLTYVINGAAYVAVAIITYLVSTSYGKDVDYIFMDYTILAATVYFIAAGMFAYYAWAVAAELKEVPIQLPARKNRLSVLRQLSLIVILALVVKAGVLITITGRSVRTESPTSLVAVFLYYAVLELFPLLIVLLFYRVESGTRGDESSKLDRGPYDESDGLIMHSAASVVSRTSRGSGDEGGGSKTPSKRATGPSPIRTLPRYDKDFSAPADVVNQIIARLSGSSDPNDYGTSTSSVSSVSSL